ncbi:S8 family serine peptidase [Lysobacter auxotrophicus]|uniref:S8 family serine peptidase n=1 Tax=Lysobacter auxotrophicus TaxID=2992573 RepID=A0ABM8DAW7_9GAMM|nr:S8 family serine peptidase [Lysobacter auxotrophicus]BDU15712.1 S8 family serine peptidase [Lysobacter auxotrophicus]
MSFPPRASRRARRLWALSLAAFAALSGLAPAFAQDARIHLSGTDIPGGTDRFIVRYRDGSAPRRDAVALRSTLGAAAAVTGRATKLQSLRRMATGAEVIRADRKLDRIEAAALMRGIAADPDVEYVEVDKLNHALLVPNDTRYAEQWGWSGTYGIRADQTWNVASGAGVVVAVVDSGIVNHSDLSANVLPGYDFIEDPWNANDGDGRDADARDPGDWVAAGACYAGSAASNSLWHGTHVAGTIAAVTNNGKGVAGVAYGAKLLPVRVLGRCGAYDSDIADGVIWASGGAVPGVPANTTPAEVINISLGGEGACGITLQKAFDAAVSRGSTVVVAAGNENIDASLSVPSNCRNVIVVGASTATGERAAFSNHGALVDIAAPGVGILSTYNAGLTSPTAETYAALHGTSMAAPHVAGVVALIQSVSPTPKTPAQIEALLKSTATPFPATPSMPIGAGIVNARAAVEAVMPPPIVALANGVPVTGLSGARLSERLFALTVPAGATGLTFTTVGGTGDADLYVKFGSAPTTTSYQCRSIKSGNAETCGIATAQAGTYYVMLRGYAAYSGVSLTARYAVAVPTRVTYGNTTEFAIRDLGSIESPIVVAGRTGNAPANASVAIDIAHTYRGDLKVDLVAPDGTLFNLHNRSGGSADDLVKSVELDLSSKPLNGTWKLRVYDGARGDTGRLRQWSITF